MIRAPRLARRWLARVPAARALADLIRRGRRAPPPVAPADHLSHVEPGNQWYSPVLAGPSTFVGDVVGAPAVRDVLAVLERLSADRYMEFLQNHYRRGLAEFGDRWVYADANTVLLGLSRRLAIESYLEIGVRRGMSMAMVASQRPAATIAGFDAWIDDYAGMPNPGEGAVRDQLRRVGYRGALELVAGDSKRTVPAYFRRRPDRVFDLVTVDGDHSRRGAAADVANVLPRLRRGGAIVFDDIANPAHPGLRTVWDRLVVRSGQFATYAFTELGFGVAFGIRI